MIVKVQRMLTRILRVHPIIVITIIMVLGDFGLFIMDLFFGEERGVIFGYNLVRLIITTNSIVVGILSLIWITKYLVRARKGKVTIVIIYLLGNVLCVVGLIIGYRLLEPIVAFNVIFLFSWLVVGLSRGAALAKNMTVAIFSFLFTIFLVEVMFYIIIKINSRPGVYAYDEKSDILFRTDSIQGYAHNKLVTANLKKILVDEVNQDTSYVFHTTIHVDSIGNRITAIPYMTNRDKYAIFIGCSVTFGLGVEDDETLPYYFAQYDSGYCAYNFGVGGYGPQNVLALLSNYNLKKFVKQDSGVCIYSYIKHHVYRAIGDMATYTAWGESLPYYDYELGKLIRVGSFGSDRRLISGFYTLMSKSNFVRYFKLNFPPKLTARHYKISCDMIRQTRDLYRQQFNNDNFYVMIMPTNFDQPMIDCLSEYGVKIIDVSKLFASSNLASMDSSAIKDLYFIPHDGHPTPLAYRLIAGQLADQLERRTELRNNVNPE